MKKTQIFWPLLFLAWAQLANIGWKKSVRYDPFERIILLLYYIIWHKITHQLGSSRHCLHGSINFWENFLWEKLAFMQNVWYNRVFVLAKLSSHVAETFEESLWNDIDCFSKIIFQTFPVHCNGIVATRLIVGFWVSGVDSDIRKRTFGNLNHAGHRKQQRIIKRVETDRRLPFFPIR